MAIRDLLWACPFCSVVSAVRRDGRIERCIRCGATFERRTGSCIRATPRGGDPVERSAPEWLDSLPPLPPVPDGSWGPEPVLVRTVTGSFRVLKRREFLGRTDRFGPERPGTLSLDPAGIRLRSPGIECELAFEDFAALQPSSASIILRPREGPLLRLAFPDSSVLLWEHWLQCGVRRRWAALGRRPVRDFHPEIR